MMEFLLPLICDLHAFQLVVIKWGFNEQVVDVTTIINVAAVITIVIVVKQLVVVVVVA